ncbi:redoxin family protein [Candidatus Mycoplasma mahonii]|uniref:redoxin family protein n=1 Tax=Candidatus Mycoplasma mahonii TaxID=3004105 RepID=UPI0026EE63B6|nr:redoxin family protein [Candidatus Mycoplasma mahonii]WKX02358.1 redoxin domain-containing protein [Candidatus Mycoplasma mahonii]
MDKVTIKGDEFKLIGELISEGSKLDFKAVNREGKDMNFSDLKGLVIISTFPDITTSVCDDQTQWIAKIAAKHKDIKFLSLTADPVDTINDWCLAHGYNNIDIWTDQYKEFGNNTNSIIEKIGKLTRGFMIVKNGVIEKMAYKNEIAEEPNYKFVEDFLV